MAEYNCFNLASWNHLPEKPEIVMQIAITVTKCVVHIQKSRSFILFIQKISQPFALSRSKQTAGIICHHKRIKKYHAYRSGINHSDMPALNRHDLTG